MNIYFASLLALFAAVQNIDNIVLAGAYRLKGTFIPLTSNALIAIFSGLATGLGATVGWSLGRKAVEMGHPKMNEMIARGLLIMLGVWTIIGYLRRRLFPALYRTDGHPDRMDAGPTSQRTNVIRTWEATIVGIALACDNLAPSFAFGARLQVGSFFALMTLSLFTAAFSFFGVWLGQRAGSGSKLVIDRIFPRFVSPEMVSGVLTITIALCDPGDFAQTFLR